MDIVDRKLLVNGQRSKKNYVEYEITCMPGVFCTALTVDRYYGDFTVFIKIDDQVKELGSSFASVFEFNPKIMNTRDARYLYLVLGKYGHKTPYGIRLQNDLYIQFENIIEDDTVQFTLHTKCEVCTEELYKREGKQIYKIKTNLVTV